jgi:TPR repeat protein
MRLLSKFALVAALAFAGLMPAACASHKVAEPTVADARKLMNEDRMFDAFNILKPLAEKGDPDAQYELGGIYHYGYMGANDYTKASAWYQRAAKQGNTDAMIGLAALYGTKAAGKYGTDIDHMSAFTWLTIASLRETDPQALAKIDGLRDHLEDGLTPEQLDAALAAARAYQPVPETAQGTAP